MSTNWCNNFSRHNLRSTNLRPHRLCADISCVVRTGVVKICVDEEEEEEEQTVNCTMMWGVLTKSYDYMGTRADLALGKWRM